MERLKEMDDNEDDNNKEEDEPSSEPFDSQYKNNAPLQSDLMFQTQLGKNDAARHSNPFYQPTLVNKQSNPPLALSKGNSRRKSGNDMESESRIFELHYTIMHGSLEAIQVLIKHLPQDINVRDQNGYTALHKAVSRGKLTVVQFLVESGARLDLSGLDGYAPIHVAAYRNDYKILEYLLNHRADPNDFLPNNKKAIDLTTDEKCKNLLQTFMDKANQADVFSSEMSRKSLSQSRTKSEMD